MNKRIQELVEQADKFADDILQNDEFRIDWYEARDEKFVELVVKECIDYCGENLSKTVGGALKIHFGIEE
jgi:vacuolar-type H+-ATPase subunit H